MGKKLKNVLWKSSNISETASLALFINMPLCCGFKGLASRFLKWWTNKRWRWWWCVNLVMSVFKTEKLTWQGKLQACLHSEIKYCIQSMLYICWEGKRLVSKCLRLDIMQAKDLWFCFPLWDCVARYDTNIWETWNTFASRCSCDFCCPTPLI